MQTLSRLRLTRTLAMGLAVLTMAWVARGSALDLARDALWTVVQTCVAAKQTVGVALPCLDVVLATPDRPGFAIVPSPWSATHVLVVPTARLIGIEAALQQPGAQTYWQVAVAARHFVTEASDGRVPPDHVGLAINSKGSRTQDQLHIHLDCVDPAVLSFVRDQDRAITAAWTLVPAWLKGTRWFALRLRAADLGSVDVFDRLMHLPGYRRDLASVAVALISAPPSPSGPSFVLLAIWGPSSEAERLLDHTCAIARRDG